MTDPIADMLTRIRNAQMVKKFELVMPYSKLKFNILTLLAKQGWIESVKKIEPGEIKSAGFRKQLHESLNNRFASLLVKLKYDSDKKPHISQLKRVSKPGRRVYVSKNQIPYVLNGKGLSIISTSHGLLTDKQARQKKIGGEVICEIY